MYNCQKSFDSETELKNHMNKKRKRNKSDQNDDYESVKDNAIELKNSKDNDPEVNS